MAHGRRRASPARPDAWKPPGQDLGPAAKKGPASRPPRGVNRRPGRMENRCPRVAARCSAVVQKRFGGRAWSVLPTGELKQDGTFKAAAPQQPSPFLDTGMGGFEQMSATYEIGTDDFLTLDDGGRADGLLDDPQGSERISPGILLRTPYSSRRSGYSRADAALARLAGGWSPV